MFGVANPATLTSLRVTQRHHRYRSCRCAAVKAYGALAVPALKALGARFLTGSASQIEPHEAGLQLRTIVVEFDSYDIALAARKSEAYQRALKALGTGADRDFRIVEGA